MVYPSLLASKDHWWTPENGLAVDYLLQYKRAHVLANACINFVNNLMLKIKQMRSDLDSVKSLTTSYSENYSYNTNDRANAIYDKW